jgi:transcriptional regulator with XRE-family HTH domain
MTITTAQIRGARGLLNWTQQDLSERTDISATSIGAIENGQTMPRESTLQAFRKAFEDSGVEFTSGDGVRKKDMKVDFHTGEEGFKNFSLSVYDAAANDARPILQAYVDDVKFAKALGNEALPHVERIEKIKGKKFMILQREGDIYFPAKNYASYRWIPEEKFIAVPFIVFADKFAIILYEPEPTVIVMNYPILANAYRMQFQALWDQAIDPPKNLIDDWTVPEKFLKRK